MLTLIRQYGAEESLLNIKVKLVKIKKNNLANVNINETLCHTEKSHLYIRSCWQTKVKIGENYVCLENTDNFYIVCSTTKYMYNVSMLIHRFISLQVVCKKLYHTRPKATGNKK